MNTTELFVEQIVIGMVVLVTCALMVSPQLVDDLYTSNIGEVAVLLAVAYLIGIVYDRVADTLLQDCERHQRLLYALERYYKEARATRDPFPEDELRHRVLTNDNAAAQAGYFRTRIRLSRATATLVPAVGMAIGLNTLPPAWEAQRVALAMLVAAAYGVAFLFKTYVPKATANARRRFARLHTEALADGETRAWYQSMIGGYLEAERTPALSWGRFMLRNEPLTSLTLILAIAAGLVAGLNTHWLRGLGLTIATFGVTALCVWTWSRILRTFFVFLRGFAAFETPASRNSARP